MSDRTRPPPTPPRPDLVRTPLGSFGWLEDRLLHEGVLARLEPDATAVLVLLSLAADRRGASWWGRPRMAQALGVSIDRVDRALRRLLDLGLVAHRPWRHADKDGVWQILPLSDAAPRRSLGTPDDCDTAPGAPRPASGPTPLGEVLAQLGIRRPAPRQPESRGS